MRNRQIFSLLPTLLFCTMLFMAGCASQQVAQPKVAPSPSPTTSIRSKPQLPRLPTRPSREGTLVFSYRDPQAGAFQTVAWSPDGTRIASLDSTSLDTRYTLHIWDALTGRHPVAYQMNEAFVPIPFVWSPDSTHIAHIDQKLVKILDVRSGKTVLVYSGHRDDVQAIAWSPNGRYVASAGGIADKTVQVWDSRSGKTLYTYRGHRGAIFSIAWSPDSRRIASNSSAFDIQVWDALTGSHVSILTIPHAAQSTRIATLAWSPDGTRIAASHGGGVDIVNAATGKDVLSYQGYSVYEVPFRLLWSPDSKRIITMYGDSDNGLQLWDSATGSFVYHYRLGPNLLATDASWSPDGRFIAMTAVRNVLVWDASPGREALVHGSQKGGILSVAWSPNGRYIASTSDDSLAGTTLNSPTQRTLQVWEAPTGKVLFTYRSNDLLGTLAWSPDSKRIAVASLEDANSTVRVFDAMTGGHQLIYHGHSHSIFALGWSHDGRRIASGDSAGTINIWDAQSGRDLNTYSLSSTAIVYSLAWSPDDRFIAVASGGEFNSDPGQVDVLSASGGSDFTYKGHTGGVLAVAWSPDGKRIASGGVDQTVQVWDAFTGHLDFTYRGHVDNKPADAVQDIAWSPDGRRIVSVSDAATRGVQVWDAANGGHLYLFTGHLDKVDTVCWSPNGRYIATGSADVYDSTVQVWRDQTGATS